MPETTLKSPSEKVRPRGAGAARPRRSFSQRFRAGFRAWARDTFSREQLMSSVKSLMWVVPLTILIWVYAEREQTATQTVDIRVQARSGSADRLVQFVGDARNPDVVIIQAKISGPQAGVDQVKEKLQSGSPMQIDIDPNTPLGRGALPASILSNQPLFVQNGLTLSDMAPTRIDLDVDSIDHLVLPVQAPPSLSNLVGLPAFDPPRISVSGPHRLFEEARKQGKLVAQAVLENYTEPGVKEIPSVLVTVPAVSGDPHVNISPTTVAAKFTIARSEVAGVVQSMPVWPIYPPVPVWDKYKAEYDLNLTGVQVTGPPDVIADINKPEREVKPKAYVDLSTAVPPVGADPIVGSTHTARLRFDTGDPAVKVSPNDPHKTITVTIVERKTGE